jgi:prevent-host-death family protein
MAKWRVEHAKARFSELIEKARTEGPQTITRHGRECAVLMSIEDYRSLLSRQPDVRTVLLGGPKVDGFGIERDGDTGRRSLME